MTAAHHASHHNQIGLTDVTAPPQLVAACSRTNSQPHRRRSWGHSDCSFPNCFIERSSVARPSPSASLNVNPQLPGNSRAMPCYHQNQPPKLHLPSRMLLETHGHMETNDEDQRHFQVVSPCTKTTVFLPLLLISLPRSPDPPYPICRLYTHHFPYNMTWFFYLAYLVEISQLQYSPRPLFQHLPAHTCQNNSVQVSSTLKQALISWALFT